MLMLVGKQILMLENLLHVYTGNNPVSWCSKRKQTVSRSSIEAEYKNIACATAEIMWIQSLFSELKANTNTIPVLWSDSLSAISLSTNLVLHSKTKQMEIDLYFVHEQVIKGKLQVNHIPST